MVIRCNKIIDDSAIRIVNRNLDGCCAPKQATAQQTLTRQGAGTIESLTGICQEVDCRWVLANECLSVLRRTVGTFVWAPCT